MTVSGEEFFKLDQPVLLTLSDPRGMALTLTDPRTTAKKEGYVWRGSVRGVLVGHVFCLYSWARIGGKQNTADVT